MKVLKAQSLKPKAADLRCKKMVELSAKLNTLQSMYIYIVFFIVREQEKEKLKKKKEESCRTLRKLESEKDDCKNITESFLVPNS